MLIRELITTKCIKISNDITSIKIMLTMMIVMSFISTMATFFTH